MAEDPNTSAPRFDSDALAIAALETHRSNTHSVPLSVLRPRRWSRPIKAQRAPVLSDEERAFLQDRFAMFTRAMTLLFLALVASASIFYLIFPEMRSANNNAYYAFAGGMILITLGLWLYCRRIVLPARILRGLDAALMLLAGLSLAAGAFVMSDKPHNFWLSYIFSLFIVFSRALVVPSTGQRTLWISTLGVAPMMVAAVAITTMFPERLQIAPMAMVQAGLTMAFLQVMLATLGSSVIYGLRADFRQAAQLGQYTLTELIGEGGMGTVYKAKHAMMRRPTAIKILRADRSSPSTIRRFEREVQATSELTHANTIAIYDYGRSPDGVFYYVMEYLDGINLEDLVRRDGPLGQGRVIHTLRQVCAALAEAHNRGLIHRDIKPANIILCERGGAVDVAKVLDFGLVKNIEESGDQSAGEIVAGTPLYMSPEAITEPESVAEGSDIYAIGALAYFLITGAPVFTGKTVAEICGHHMYADPVPPRKGCPNADIDDAFEELILSCLAKAVNDRPLSAQDLADELAALPAANSWSQQAAKDWWSEFRFEQQQPGASDAQQPGKGAFSTIDVDFEDRL